MEGSTNLETGRVGETVHDLPIRMVTLNDARFITTALTAYTRMLDRLAEAIDVPTIDADVRDRIERIILDLDAPPS